MQNTTLLIGVLGAVLVLVLPPRRALAAYFAVLIWYPDYLRFSLGTLDISAGRVVVITLFMRCMFNDRLRKSFNWTRLDTWFGLSTVVYVVMYCLTIPGTEAIENRGGFVMDTWLVYIVARLCISDRAALVTMIKMVAVILVPLALLGVIEAVGGWYSYRNLHQYCPWRPEIPEIDRRYGLTRAHGPFSHCIMFGSCFVMFLPLIWALRKERDYWGNLAYWLSAIAVIGALSSMSSGPWGMLMVVIICLYLEKYSRKLKNILLLFVLGCILLQVVSNRPFYHVLLEFGNFGKGSWFQRAKLIDGAIASFDEWWVAGYYGEDPGWGAAAGMGFTDCNNEFLLKAIEYGMLGVIALTGTFVVAFQGLGRAFKKTADKGLRSLYWALGCSLVGLIVMWHGVSFFGQSVALFHCLLGMIGSSFALAEQTAAEAGAVSAVRSGDYIQTYG